MLILHTLRDTIRVTPPDFKLRGSIAVSKAILEKYTNKLLPGVGLSITLYDVQDCGEFRIYPGEGDAFVDVRFRLVVFCPFPGEILYGTVLGLDEKHGIQVTLNFFKHVLIQPIFLPQQAQYDDNIIRWIWDDDDGKFISIEKNSQIRFRVVSTSFYPLSRPPHVIPGSGHPIIGLPQKQSEDKTVTLAQPKLQGSASSSQSGSQSQSQIPFASPVPISQTSDSLANTNAKQGNKMDIDGKVGPAAPTEEEHIDLADMIITKERVIDGDFPMIVWASLMGDGVGLVQQDQNA
ncbi:MAG: DNA-directed RNA polymerase III subunit RPC8 [Streblomastix strix]|uniref:DNA-directed RNA polymerase III subunit RPC8 n=1 Tax=Streblomastix strix TaxID=222440 RepID=A0A5J4WQP9_9EUKA|nr:MAG: DNA-directed RNA polymerase III subunit RPC8 [Streblomastix strix]